jgi:hypothetical protein
VGEHESRTVGLRQGSGERQSNADVVAVTASEDVLDRVGGNTVALVGDVDCRAARKAADAEIDRATPVAERVVDEDVEDLFDGPLGRLDPDMCAPVDIEPTGSRLDPSPPPLFTSAENLVEIEQRRTGRCVAGMVEEVFDGSLQSSDVGEHLVDR